MGDALNDARLTIEELEAENQCLREALEEISIHGDVTSINIALKALEKK